MSNNYSAIVSGILAQALVTLPRITAADLYEKCKGEIGNVSLVAFRIDLAKWVTDGTIPGYEGRLGRMGGYYKVGAPTETLNPAVSNAPKLDPGPIEVFILEYLKTNIRITVGTLLGLVDHSPLTEVQFRGQMSEWLNDGKTFPQFETHKGPTGGIYMKGSEREVWIPADIDSDEVSEGSFTVKVSKNVQIVQADERNWVIQKRSGETWVSKYYHPTLSSVLTATVKHSINGEFKLAKDVVCELSELSKMYREMESRLVAQLNNHIAQA